MDNGSNLFGGDWESFASGDLFGDSGGGDVLGTGGLFDIGGAPGVLSSTVSGLYQGSIVPVARPSLPAPAPGGDLPGFMRGMGRGIAARFPVLWGAIQIWRGRGVAMTAEKLWGLVRRFGPQLLITAGILSAGALSELLLWRTSRKRRRMNVLNPKALTRSTRRLLGFERRAARVSMALGGISRSRRRGRGSGRRSACVVCHQSPCRCS